MTKNKIKKNDIFFEKGAISIVLAVLILSLIFTIVIGISALTIQQVRSSRQTGQSVIAFYAADSGAERCLYDIRKSGAVVCSYTDISLDFSSQAKYTTTYDGFNTITSKGEYKDISRKVELNW